MIIIDNFAKMSEIIYINELHEKIVENYLTYVKKQVYEATESCNNGKFTDFQEILSDILMYHNDFSDFGLKVDSFSEWLFTIPNLAMFTTLGFFAGLKNDNNEDSLNFHATNIHSATMEVVGQLSDMIKDIEEANNLEKQC